MRRPFQQIADPAFILSPRIALTFRRFHPHTFRRESMSMRTLTLAGILFGTCTACVAEPRILHQQSTISFTSTASIELSNDQSRFTVKPKDGVSLSGSLQFPPGDGPFPAVVLAHGCNGIGQTERAWAEALRTWGYATFLLDSFAGRNVAEVCTNPWALAPLQRVPDVFGALRVLAGNPSIDARRIALMGFSHGGIVALNAATTWAFRTFAPKSGPSFRAFIALYPYCNVSFPEQAQISGPLRIHIGELDDWTPAVPCERMTSHLVKRGQNAGITVYPGAHHGFDAVDAGRILLPEAVNAAACSFDIPSILGPFPFRDALARCTRKGATVEENTAATAAARNNVRMEIEELLD
ncbi:MAG: dienelactone hydrolase family protein [Rhodocyclaceae bacterium]|nr:dienelactone hydrolase family protein [Rhodocyclaceae bacterium]